jgi:hydrogenase-4 component E
LLSRVLQESGVHREVEPVVGYIGSLLLGMLTLAVSFWLSARLPLPRPAISVLVVPVALFTTLAGLFLIVTRRTALTQVLGYLVLENGIYVFGVSLAQDTPMLVELGVLLDVFVAVFVMGIAIFHINREFDHIDTEQLTSLRDWTA